MAEMRFEVQSVGMVNYGRKIVNNSDEVKKILDEWTKEYPRVTGCMITFTF